MSAKAEKLSLSTLPLDRRRVYILPSRYGVILGALLFAMLLGSINYDNALGYLLTFLIGGLYLVAMLHTYRNIVGLKAANIAAENAYIGEHIAFQVNLENTQASDKFNLTLAAQSEPRAWFKRRSIIDQTVIAKVPGLDTRAGCLAIKPTRRGRMVMPRIKISSSFPLGIFTAWAYFPHKASALVFPQALGRLPLPSTAIAPTDNHAATGRGDADFHSLREYSGGEPIKRIAWRALAKYDELLVKQFSGDSDTQLLLDWRFTTVLGDTESRLSQLCLWVLQAHQMRLSFGLIIPTKTIPLGSGDAHCLRCLEALAEF